MGMPQASSTKPALIFDLDGTLFQAETLFLPAFQMLFDELHATGRYCDGMPSADVLLGGLGYPFTVIWQRVLPNATDEVRNFANSRMVEIQKLLLAQGIGSLYDGVHETLATLCSRGHRLFVASNGMEAYVKSVIAAMNLAPLFEALYSAGEYCTESKVDLVLMLLQHHHVTSAVMIGDRASDVEAGIENDLPVVGCDYSDFGKTSELDGSTYRIRSVRELLTLPLAT